MGEAERALRSLKRLRLGRPLAAPVARIDDRDDGNLFIPDHISVVISLYAGDEDLRGVSTADGGGRCVQCCDEGDRGGQVVAAIFAFLFISIHFSSLLFAALPLESNHGENIARRAQLAGIAQCGTGVRVMVLVDFQPKDELGPEGVSGANGAARAAGRIKESCRIVD